MASDPLIPKRPLVAWVFVLVAIMFGVLAMIIVLKDSGGQNKNATTWITILNLVTGLFSVGGALGYSLRKNWGLGAFGISVLGHIINHGYLMASLIHVGRASVAG